MVTQDTSNSSGPLHIPELIRFQCTRCANCCNSWPVPLNGDDVSRLSSTGQELVYSALSSAEKQDGLQGFSHALEKRDDGRCVFLSPSEACLVHETAKPAMCKLFPYSFMDCPEGVYLGLSFASSGVLHNSGALLSEQQKELQETLQLFRELFPDLRPSSLAGWSKIQLLEGLALPYGQARLLIQDLLRRLADSLCGAQDAGALEILCDFYNELVSKCPSSFFRPRIATSSSAQVDNFWLSALFDSYLSERFKPVNDQILAVRVAEQISQGDSDSCTDLSLGAAVALQTRDRRLELSSSSQNLLLRFVFMRVFSRMFFGPGFSSLSFIAGLGHLTSLIALLHLDMKVHMSKAVNDQTQNFDQFNYLAEQLRQLDGKLTSARYGNNCRAMLELLFLDNRRLDRLRELAL
jgi:Fe-S-cluster containining protein